MHAVLPVATIILYGLYNLPEESIHNVELPSKTSDVANTEVPYQINPKISSITHLTEILRAVQSSLPYVDGTPSVENNGTLYLPINYNKSGEDFKDLNKSENFTEANVPIDIIPHEDPTRDTHPDADLILEEERKAEEGMNDQQTPTTTMAIPVKQAVDINSISLESPCPDIFTYQGRIRMGFVGSLLWTGVIKIENPPPNFVLDLELDKAPQLLSGAVTSTDNIYFQITNLKSNSSQAISITIIVKYSDKELSPPKIKSIELNGKKICQNAKDIEDDPDIFSEEERKVNVPKSDQLNPTTIMADPVNIPEIITPVNKKSVILESPCPDIFSYQGRIRMGFAGSLRWSGVIKIENPPPNLVLDLELDKAPQLLSSLQGAVTSTDNIYFQITNIKSNSSQAISITIIVKYSDKELSPPKIKSIELNGKKICQSAKDIEDDPDIFSEEERKVNVPKSDQLNPTTIMADPVNIPEIITPVNKKSVILESPCPDIFSYQGRIRMGFAGSLRWSGVIKIENPPPNIGLDLELDKEVQLIASLQGEVQSTDNIHFQIKGIQSNASQEISITVFVKYSDKELSPPKIKSIKLNGEQICPIVKDIDPDQVAHYLEERKGEDGMNDQQTPTTTIAVPVKIPVNMKSVILESPCPDIFSYQGRIRMGFAGSLRWSGVIKIEKPPPNVVLDLELDKAPQLVSSFQGEVQSTDNIHIQIKDIQSNASQEISIVIIVEYSNEELSPPKMKSIKLNGEQICPIVKDDPIALYPSSKVPILTKFRPEQTTLSNSVRNAEFDKPFTSTTDYPIIKSSRELYDPLLDPTNTCEYVDGVRCGISEAHPPSIYSYRNYAARGEWPWYAAIYQTVGSNLIYLCSGTLIGKRTVLTAANCVCSRMSNKTLDPVTLVVYLGKYHLALWSEGGVQDKQVRKINIHPDYTFTDFGANIAVLVLSSPVDFTLYVRPICLWKKNEPQLKDLEDKEGVLVGWGYDEQKNPSSDLKINKMVLVSKKLCTESHQELFSEFTLNRTFCAGFTNDSRMCSGESGTGIIFPKNDDHSQQVTWFLGGIFSLCPSKKNLHVCNKKNLIVFTDVGIYYDWIKKFLSR